jgi:chaperonin GroES
MIDKLIAVGEFVFVLRDEPETERNGLLIPEGAKQKPNTGTILSVGQKVEDTNIVQGRTAVFNKQAGNTIEIFDTEITVLNGNQQLLGVL